MGNETIRQMKTIMRHAPEHPVENWQKANGPAFIFLEMYRTRCQDRSLHKIVREKYCTSN